MERNWARFFNTAHCEDDAGFRQVIYDVSRKGMVAVGLLGIASVAINFITNALAGYLPALTYANPGEAIVIWDKLVMAIFSLLYIWLSRTEKGPKWARPIGVGMAITATMAIILDDLGQQSVYVSHQYIGIIILLLVSAIPYRLQQAVAFCVLTSTLYVVASSVLSDRFNIEGYPLSAGVFVYLFIVFFLVAGISSLLYRTRYDEYLARKSARDAEQKVRQLEKAKSQFFANISHEFRTPLTLILGPIQDAISGKYGDINSVFESRLGVVERNASQLQNLIDELLDLSSLEAGKLSLQVAPYVLDELLRPIVASFESLAESSKIEFDYEIQDNSVEVVLDRKRFHQIVTNLLSNAFKFTGSNGRIRLTAGETQTGIAISVKDNGQGIQQSEQPFIFDRFKKLESLKNVQGSGIGLALVKELVELHNGTTEVVSDPGFGSEFTVTFRKGREHFHESCFIETAPSSDDATKEFGIPGIETNGIFEPLPEVFDKEHTVLVIDDNADMRSYLVDIFRPSYNVLEAVHGVQGLEVARKSEPDMIVSDVMMPEMDGIEFCRQIRNDPDLNHIPVILLTAKASAEAREEGLMMRADDYVTKPFSSTELLLRAENLIEIRKTLHLKYGSRARLQPTQPDDTDQVTEFLSDVQQIVEREISNSYFSVDHLSDELGLSRRQVERRLKSAVGLTPAGYVRVMRLERAAQLLQTGFGTVSTVAREVGFPDPSYFSKLFKQAFGVPPSSYSADH